jgi:hypothetical protein
MIRPGPVQKKIVFVGLSAIFHSTIEKGCLLPDAHLIGLIREEVFLPKWDRGGRVSHDLGRQ